VLPFGIEGAFGVTAIDFRAAAVTVRVVLPDIPLSVAVTVVLPRPAPVANPLALIVAAEAMEELHATDDVMSFKVPSL
jgi:hypothetical protein